MIAYSKGFLGKDDVKDLSEASQDEVMKWFIENIEDDFVADITDQSWFALIVDNSYLGFTTATWEKFW